MEPKNKHFTGICSSEYDETWRGESRYDTNKQVYRDTNPLLIDRHNANLLFSPTFDWGCRSKGTKQTAVSMLLEIADTPDALRYSDPLAEQFLALLPSHDNWTLQVYGVQQWLQREKNLSDKDVDLMLWTEIEKPLAKKGRVLLVPDEPPAKKDTRAGRSKYPFAKLDVGQYFYWLSPTREELHTVSVTLTNIAKKTGREFTRRIVTSDWMIEQGVPLGQRGITVGIVWRVK